MFVSAKTAVRTLIFTLLILLLYFALSAAEDQYALKRKQMVDQDIRNRGIQNSVVLSVMGRVPRHLFVDAAYRHRAYDDHPLPIGEAQTISQPYVVALMTEALGLRPADRVLEIGTGSGYQAAVLAEIVKEVCTIRYARALLPGLKRPSLSSDTGM